MVRARNRGAEPGSGASAVDQSGQEQNSPGPGGVQENTGSLVLPQTTDQVQNEGGLGSKVFPVLRDDRLPARAGRGAALLVRPVGFLYLVFLWLAAAGVGARGQQPVNPTQPPAPASPEEQRKKTPPVPPGSVLPSYNSTQQ